MVDKLIQLCNNTGLIKYDLYNLKANVYLTYKHFLDMNIDKEIAYKEIIENFNLK